MSENDLGFDFLDIFERHHKIDLIIKFAQYSIEKEVRCKTIEVLGRLKDPRAVEPLIQTLKDEEWQVREKAVEILSNLGDTRMVEPLIQLLKDQSKEVRYQAAYALGRICLLYTSPSPRD